MDLNFFLNPGFYAPTIAGLLGLFGSLLSKWLDPKDDTVAGALKNIFVGHSRSSLSALITYLIACVAAFEAQQLNYVAAIGMGYIGQSLSMKFITGGKDVPPAGA